MAILPTRFFPPPLQVRHDDTSGHLIVAAPLEISAKTKFLPFFQRLSLKIVSAEMLRYPILPYDFHCPTVQRSLLLRICSDCGLYFGAQVHLTEHKKKIHQKQVTTAPRRSKRLIAKRRGEVMCLLEDDLTGSQDVEWLPEGDVIVEEEERTFDNQPEADVMVIDSLDEWMQNEWTQC